MIGTVDELIPKMLKLDRVKKYELKEHRQKRSLDANAYYWQLVTKIADIIRQDKEKIHIDMLKHYGQVSSIMMLSSIDIKGFVRYYEAESKRIVHGKEFTVYKVYKGSSEMNTKEMSALIDGVVYEAKELGIETMTPDEIAKLKSLWNKKDIGDEKVC
jgi:hypothetical protein